jgi:hypothetical protein
MFSITANHFHPAGEPGNILTGTKIEKEHNLEEIIVKYTT